MLDLNDYPDQTMPAVAEEEENSAAATDSRETENSSSSAIVVASDDADDDGDDDKAHGKIFGFSIPSDFVGENQPAAAAAAVVTRQFFPVEETAEAVPQTGHHRLPQAHWVGVQFRQSSETAAAAAAGGKAIEATQSMKKSRRGPRSRSSQYRGVTFYRRTGRWESHIW